MWSLLCNISRSYKDSFWNDHWIAATNLSNEFPGGIFRGVEGCTMDYRWSEIFIAGHSGGLFRPFLQSGSDFTSAIGTGVNSFFSQFLNGCSSKWPFHVDSDINGLLSQNHLRTALWRNIFHKSPPLLR